MDKRLKQRRTAALDYLADLPGQHSTRVSLTHPAFNLREACKHLLLLHDHLKHPYKVCPDCIHKHLMTIEAYAEEAVSLDDGGFYTPTSLRLANVVRMWQGEFIQGDMPLDELAAQVRQVRKDLAPLVCDPRKAPVRVAMRYMAAGRFCPHQKVVTIG